MKSIRKSIRVALGCLGMHDNLLPCNKALVSISGHYGADRSDHEVRLSKHLPVGAHA